MSAERKRSRLVIGLVALWVIFTVTLAGWWLVFGLRQLDLIKQSNIEAGNQLQRHYQMLMWEGGILIASLIGGGLALFITRNENRDGMRRSKSSSRRSHTMQRPRSPVCVCRRKVCAKTLRNRKRTHCWSVC